MLLNELMYFYDDKIKLAMKKKHNVDSFVDVFSQTTVNVETCGCRAK